MIPWFTRKPAPLPHVIIRHVAATRKESAAAQTRKAYTELELGIAVSRLSPEQRREAVARAATMKLGVR